MIGEFEYLMLAAATSLGDDAYGAAIRQEIEGATGRRCSIGALYTTLDRLEAKGLITTRMGDPTPQRGGPIQTYGACNGEGSSDGERFLRQGDASEPWCLVGGASSGGPMMSRICWWLVDSLSRTLESDEREAVRGDLAESNETGSQALRDVLGLVIQRQAVLWTDWQPWLTLVGLVIPLGWLFGLVSRRMADHSAFYIWLYANNWNGIFPGKALFTHDFAHYVSVTFLEYLTLACWAWAGGFLLGSLSRRITHVSAVVFCLLLFFGEFLGAPPRYLGHALFYTARDYPGNAVVFALAFYRVALPLIVQTVLVVVPSISGMRQGLRVVRLRPLLRVLLWTAAIATLTAMWRFPNPYSLPAISGWEMRLVRVIVCWPVGYVVAGMIGRHLRGRIDLGPNRENNA